MRRIIAGMVVLAVLGSAGPVGAKTEAWKKISTPAFTVITSTDEKSAVAWVNAFTHFVLTLGTIVPVNEAMLPPLTIVLFDRDRDFRRHRPLGADGKPREVDGFFIRCDDWAVAGIAVGSNDENAMRGILHEGVHWFLAGFERRNPVWLEEGMAEVFSTFAVEGQDVIWGRPIESHVFVLQRRSLMRLEELLFLARSDLFGGDLESQDRTGMAYAQSWAFVHFLLFGKSDLPRGAFDQYARNLRSMDPDKAFSTAFNGHSYQEVEDQLKSYLDGGSYVTRKMRAAALPPLKLEPATPADVEDALARLAMAGRRRDEAKQHAEAVVQLEPNSPRGYDMLGLLCLEAKDQEGAWGAYQEAISRKTRSFRGYMVRASRREHDAGAALDAKDARGIANDFERAINCNPRHKQAYESLARILNRVDGDLRNDSKFLQQGIQLFPDSDMIALGLALVDQRAGHGAEALAAVEAVLARPVCSAAARKFGTTLQTTWEKASVNARVKELLKAGPSSDAAAMLDAEIAAAQDDGAKRILLGRRSEVLSRYRMAAAQLAVNERRFRDARRFLNEVIESDAQPIMRLNAERLLRFIGQRGSGTPGQTLPTAGAPGGTPTAAAPGASAE